MTIAVCDTYFSTFTASATTAAATATMSGARSFLASCPTRYAWGVQKWTPTER